MLVEHLKLIVQRKGGDVSIGMRTFALKNVFI